jgi:uncharacterized membrane protein YbhN (UPF0104 family)
VTQLWSVLRASLDRLATATPGWVFAALALYVASLFIVGVRWRGFVRMLGGDIGTLRATLATLGGIAIGNLTPSSRLAGEACRMSLARVDGNVTWPQIGIATAWDRLSEIPPIAVLSIVAAFAVGRTSAARRWSVLAAAITILVVAVIGLRRVRRTPPANRPGWLRNLSLQRCDSRIFAIGVGWSTLLWLQDVLRLTCAARALGIMLSPSKMALLAVLAMLGGLVPTIGGLGAVEGGLMGGLVAFGVQVPTAAAITAVERAISFGFSTAAGAMVVTLLGGRSLLTVLRARDRSRPLADLPEGTSRRSENGMAS